MTDRLYTKYLWLISTIYDAGKISFEDIARKWDEASRGNRCLSYTAVIHKNEELFQHSSSFILAYQYVVDISSQWYGE